MHLLHAALRIHESSDARSALPALAAAVEGSVALRLAAWIAVDGAVLAVWPEGADVPEALRAAARGTDGPQRCALEAGDEALLLPVRTDAAPAGALVLVSRAGAFAPAEEWEAVSHAFTRTVGRGEALRQATEERDLLRQRAEESEALHVLGLAANRTLDPDEVLSLVARFTRTLLGAHYVTVSTAEEGRIRTVATVGLRGGAPGADDPFARRVAAARKPMVLGGDGDAVADHPFHAAEGMQAGLGVPLSLFGETVGALVVGYRRTTPLAPRDTRLALTLAGHAAVAISNARLHRALADRSREAQATLQRAKEAAEEASHTKSQFLANMSHELRTPLNAIVGFSEMLIEEAEELGQASLGEDLGKIRVSGRHLLGLINDILDLSKIEAGKMELLVERVDLPALLREAAATAQPLAEARGNALEVQVDPALGTLRTDATKLRQILLNLLSNAVKFTGHGEVRVTVAAVADSGCAPGVEFRVTDTGPGIHPENHERIFHEFEQVSGAAARGGTGLGLPISRKLARLLGGDLLVRSAPGMGATFVLRLPGQDDGLEGG